MCRALRKHQALCLRMREVRVDPHTLGSVACSAEHGTMARRQLLHHRAAPPHPPILSTSATGTRHTRVQAPSELARDFLLVRNNNEATSSQVRLHDCLSGTQLRKLAQLVAMHRCVCTSARGSFQKSSKKCTLFVFFHDIPPPPTITTTHTITHAFVDRASTQSHDQNTFKRHAEA
jgi:hypothetical protein